MIQLNPTTPALTSRRRFPWRGLLLLAALAVAARVFLLESLRVASGSMEPCLHGDPQAGDEIALLRWWWQLVPPRRFDLVVFARPPDETRRGEEIVVKRVAAVGGESVRIADGELWIREPGGVEKAVVKSYDEFHPLLVPLFREPFDGDALARLEPLDRDLVEAVGRELHLDGREEGSEAGVRLASAAARFDDGFLAADGSRVEGEHEVSDLLFAVDLAVEDAASCIVLQLPIAGQPCEFIATPVGGGYRVSFACRGESRAQGTASHVKVGQPLRFEFFLVDGRIGAAVDGDVAFWSRFDRDRSSLAAGGTVGAPTLLIRQGRARLVAFEVARDLHFTRPNDAHFAVEEPFEVPEGSCFVVGDASAQSIDSRYYGAIERAALRGRPIGVIAPGRRRRWLW
ncbi:MAG: S26 family signal peptidase [Planctomycetes bacterium]|nr:S26 family signal peptidase [Planctomycetota bacterium]